MARAHGTLLTALLAAAPAPAQEPRANVFHRGPVVALAVRGEAVFAASQSGLWRHAGAEHARVLQPTFRIADVLPTDDGFLLVGGIPGETGRILRCTATGVVRHARDAGFDLVGAVVRTRAGFVVGDAEGHLRRLDPDDLAARGEVRAHTQAVRALAVGPSGAELVSVGLDGVLRVFTAELEHLRSYTDHTAGIESVALSEDGSWIASGARDGKVRVHAWEGRLRRTWTGLGATVTALAFLAPERLAIGLADGRVLAGALEDGSLEELARFDPVHALARDPAGGLLVGTTAVWRIPPPTPANHARGVVLVIVDQLDGRDVEAAPVFARLASQGVRMEAAYAAGLSPTASHAAVQSGRAPERVLAPEPIHPRRVDDARRTGSDAGAVLREGHAVARALPRAEITLAELLRNRGFRCAHVGPWHLGPAGHLPIDQGYDVDRSGSERVAEDALAFLRSCGAAPFFLHVVLDDDPAAQHAGQPIVEATLGRILEALDEVDLHRDTLAIVTAARGRASAGASDRALRVPLLARWPAVIAPGSRSTVPAHSVDLFPTIAHATGATPPIDRPYDGIDLLTPWRDPDAAARAATRTLVWHVADGISADGGPFDALRRGPWMLVHDLVTDRSALFDLVTDPARTIDRASEHPALVAELSAELHRTLEDRRLR